MRVKNYLKQSMGWVIDSKHNIFLRARLKLASFYVIVITVIMIAFSLGLYVSIEKNIKDNINEKFKEHALRKMAIEQADEQLRRALIMGDGIFLLFFSGIGFFLAGKNLQPIEEALYKQKRFTADASHDLRTPLAIMKTDCEVSLRKKEFSEKVFHELVESNLEEINRMSAMVDQLLFLSRNHNTSNQLRELISLEECTGQTLRSFKNLAASKNVTLSMADTVAGAISANRLNLEKILFNLLKNAIDYTLAGGKIVASIRKNKEQMVLSLKDTGIGISPEDLPRVTEAFYKADTSRSEETGGSGLGLSIVKKIVEELDGKLEIKSQLGIGTEILVIFPRA